MSVARGSAPAQGETPARAALAGNPSDGYDGAVLAVTVDQFRARVSAAPAATLSVSPPSALVEATVQRFARELCGAGLGTALEWTTSIPRGVGLGGSSAIVIAVLRPLSELHHVTLSEAELASFALAVETDELGIAAGLQDRVAQAYGGLTFMEFGTSGRRYERLDPALLPPLVVAWRSDAATDSGRTHSDLRARFERGEPLVHEAIEALGAAARTARAALLAGDRAELARCADASFDARRRMIALDSRHTEMISIARACGAGANYSGSGGAIVAVCRDEHRATVAGALQAVGCGTSPLGKDRRASGV